MSLYGKRKLISSLLLSAVLLQTPSLFAGDRDFIGEDSIKSPRKLEQVNEVSNSIIEECIRDANNGDRICQYILGLMYGGFGAYESYEGIKINYEKAAIHFRMVTQNENASQAIKAEARSYKKIAKLLATATSEEADLKAKAEAQAMLGGLYFTGKPELCISPNYEEAIKWFRMAAESDEDIDPKMRGEIQCSLGVAYFFDGNTNKAEKWLQMGAKNELTGENFRASAQACLARIYLRKGFDDNRNHGETVKWLEIAARNKLIDYKLRSKVWSRLSTIYSSLSRDEYERKAGELLKLIANSPQ